MASDLRMGGMIHPLVKNEFARMTEKHIFDGGKRTKKQRATKNGVWIVGRFKGVRGGSQAQGWAPPTKCDDYCGGRARLPLLLRLCYQMNPLYEIRRHWVWGFFFWTRSEVQFNDEYKWVVNRRKIHLITAMNLVAKTAEDVLVFTKCNTKR